MTLTLILCYVSNVCQIHLFELDSIKFLGDVRRRILWSLFRIHIRRGGGWRGGWRWREHCGCPPGRPATSCYTRSGKCFRGQSPKSFNFSLGRNMLWLIQMDLSQELKAWWEQISTKKPFHQKSAAILIFCPNKKFYTAPKSSEKWFQGYSWLK